MFPEESFLEYYFKLYVMGNHDARSVLRAMRDSGFDPSALVDHCTIRTQNIKSVAKKLNTQGFEKVKDGSIDMGDWFLWSFYRPGYPIVVADQAHYKNQSSTGGGKIIHDWVERFGDEQFHHIAIRVEEIYQAVTKWTSWGVSFSDGIVCDKQTGLKQVFTKPILSHGYPYTVLEFIERPPGCTGLVVPNADKLVLSSNNK
ncbi:MAG: hypothetical protein HZC04_00460 [Candidatus Lloydbacteria bacterium]|nr:hypothetical protein [Candidatus Lloydbacteria bacterium]